jgi:hypothetical protein
MFFQKLLQLVMTGSAAVTGGGVPAQVLERANVSGCQSLNDLGFADLKTATNQAAGAVVAGVEGIIHDGIRREKGGAA